MKICITEKSVKDFNSYFKGRALELSNKNNYKTLDELFRALYNEAMALSGDTSSISNHDVIIQHLVLSPIALNGTIDSLNEDLMKAMGKSMKALSNPAELESLVLEMQKAVVTPIVLEEESDVVEGAKPQEVDYETFVLKEAVHVEFNTTLGSETIDFSGVIDASKVPAHNAVRTIVSEVKQGSSKYKIVAMTYDYLERNVDTLKLDLSIASKPSNEFAKKSSVVFVIANEKGEILEFDKNGSVTNSGSIPVMSSLTIKKLTDEYYAYKNKGKNFKEPLHIKFAAIEKAKGAEMANQIIEQGITDHKKLMAMVREQGTLLLNIDPVNSRFGYNEETDVITQLSSIKDIENFTFPRIINKFGNPHVITGNTLFEKAHTIIPNYLDTDPGVVDMLVELITRKDLTYNGVKMDPKTLRNILSNYIPVNKTSKFQITDKGSVKINNKTVLQDDNFEKRIRSFFTEFEAGELVPDNKTNRKVIKNLSEPGITSAMLFEDNSGQLYRIYKPKFSYNKDSFSTVKIEDGKVVLTPSDKNAHIIKNSGTKAFVNPNGELKVYHPKLGFLLESKEEIEDSFWLDKTDAQKEANALITKSDELAARSWMDSSPLLQGPVKVKNDLLDSQDRPENRIAVARFVGNAILLFKGSDLTDVYHEAWHAYTQGLLTISEKEQLYKEVRSVKGFKNKSNLEIEEYLAEKFREYAINKGEFKKEPKTLVGKFIRAIYDQIKTLIGNRDINSESVVNDIIKDHFKNLYTHNIDTSKYSTENFMFNMLNKSLEFPNGSSNTIQKLTAQQTSLLNQTMDTLVVKHFDKVNSEKLTRGYESLSELITIYKNVKVDLQEILDKQIALLKTQELNSEKFNFHMSNVEMLNAVLENYGNLDNISDNLPTDSNPTTTVGFHLLNSSIHNFNTIEKLIEFEEDVQDEDNTTGKIGERPGNDKSLMDLADQHIVYLLSSVTKYQTKKIVHTPATTKITAQVGKTGFIFRPKRNVLGEKELEKPVVVLAKLGKLLNSTSNGNKMVEKMEEAAKTDPVIAEVLEKLGPIDSLSFSQNLLWSKFIQTFSKSNNKLQQFIIESKIVRKSDGSQTIVLESKYGSVLSGIKTVSKAWEASFSSVGSEYIITDPKGLSLDVQRVMDDFVVDKGNGKFDLKKKDNYVEFYRALGIDISENFEIDRALIENHKIFEIIANRLKNNLEHNAYLIEENKNTISIGSLKDLMGPHSKMVNGEPVKVSGLNSYYNTLQKIEYDYSNKYNSFMSKNAEGESQSELSLNNTASVITNDINEIPEGMHIDQIISEYPHLKFLDPKNDPLIQSTVFYKELFNPNGTRRATKISFENFSGSSLVQKEEEVTGSLKEDFTGLSNMNLDANSKFMTDVYLSYFNKSEIVRMADKTTSMHVGVSGHQIVTPGTMLNILENENDPTMFNAVKDYLVAEIVRINLLENIKVPFDNSYADRGQGFFIFDDILESKTKDLLQGIKSTDFAEVSKQLTEYVPAKTLIKEVNNYFKKKTTDTFESNSGKLFITDNIIKELNETMNKSLPENEQVDLTDQEAKEILIGMYQRNKFIHNVDFTLFYLGDPALYNVDKGDFHKRDAGIISTGEVFRNDTSFYNYINNKENGVKSSRGWSNKVAKKETYKDYDGSLNTAVINDHEVGSVYIEELKKVLSDYGAYDEGKMNEADGQGFVTFDSYRLLNIAQGIWTDEQEAQYKIIVNSSTTDVNGNAVPGSYDQTKFDTYFPSMKLQYFGPLMNDAPLRQQAFHKFNLVPLIPSMIKGTKLEVLHKQMIEQGVDYMTFASGSKMSTVSNNSNGSDPLYSQDRVLDTTLQFEKNVIHSKYLKNQLRIHNHFGGKITLPSQMRKILVSSINNKEGYPKDFEGTKEEWDSITSEKEKREKSKLYDWKERYIGTLTRIKEHKLKELMNELGTQDVMSLVKDSSKLVSLIRREFRSKDYTEAQIDFLFDGNKLKQDLSTALTSDQVERLLLAIVDKRMTKIKVKGEGLIQVASTMTEANKPKMENPTQEQLFEYGTNGLRSYYTKDGKVRAMQVKIALQGDFEKLLYSSYISEETENEDGTITPVYKKITVYKTVTDAQGNKTKELDYDKTLEKLNTLLKDERWLSENRKIITLAGPRIPSQDWNSLEFMEIAEFLPKNAGNIMIVPSEIVAKAGSDFDVDKLFTMFPNFDLYNGRPELTVYGSFETDIDSLKSKIKTNKDEISKLNDLLSPLIEKLYSNKNLSKVNRELYAVNAELHELRNKKDAISLDRIKDLENEAFELHNIREYYLDEASYAEDVIPKNVELRAETKALKEQILDIKNNISELNAENDSFKRKINGASVAGLENELLGIIVERLEKENGYSELVKPNSTNKTQPLAEELEDHVASFNKYDRVAGDVRFKEDKSGKKKKLMSRTMIFDPAYNINKQLENSVGKDTLSIGAKTTSYFALFTSIGMYLNPTNGMSIKEYEDLVIRENTSGNLTKKETESLNNFVNYTIQLPHNTKTEIINGSPQTVIDLSAITNRSGDGIGDILGQLINGWVDIAKDAWIFNIQGNKEVSPTLLFLVMAGVDFRQAVMLASSSYVREYINAKTNFKSAFYGLQQLDRNDPSTHELIKFRTDLDAANIVLESIGEGKLANINDAYAKSFSFETPLDMNEIEKLVLNPGTVRTDAQKENELKALYQYISYEQTANQVTSLTTATAFDTKTFSTLAEVRTAKDAFFNLNEKNKALPSDIITKMQKSVIGMFDTNEFQLSLWEQFFSLKTNAVISAKANQYYKGKLYQKGRTKADNEKDFAQEFLSYLYQNESSRITNDRYKGYEINPFEKETEEIYRIEGDTFYYKQSYVDGLVHKQNFGNTNSVIKYLMEMAILKQTVDIESESVKNSISYEMAVENYELLSDEEKQKTSVLDEYLKAEAIILSGNSVQLFKGNTSFANRLGKLKAKHPGLVDQFYLLNDLTADSRTAGRSNLYLLNINEPGYSEIYAENLAVLKDHYDPEVKQFFRMFDRYALLQTGVKSFGKYVMTSVIDQSYLDRFITPIRQDVVSQYEKVKNKKQEVIPILEDFTSKFYQLSSNGEIDPKAFKGFLSSKGRGTSYESDFYFENSVRKIDSAELSVAEVEGTNIPKLDITMAEKSTKVILDIVKEFPIPSYSKYSKVNKYSSHINQYFPDAINNDFSESDTVWITGETVNEMAYGNKNNKNIYEGTLTHTFNTKYVPLIQKALDAGVKQFNVSSNTGIDSMAREFLKKNSGLTMHKIVNSDGTYFTFSSEKEIIVDQLYSTLGGEVNILTTLPILSLNNIPVSLAIDKNENPYTDFYKFFAKVKASKANAKEKKRIAEQFKSLKGEPTTEDWVKIINDIQVDKIENLSYDEAKDIANTLFRVSKQNLSFKNELLGTGTAMLTYGSGFTNFEKNYGRALMMLRKHFNGPATKKIDTNADPFAC